MANNNFKDYETRPLERGDLDDLLKLEEEVYADDELIQGKRLIGDIENRNGFECSVVLFGKGSDGKKELLGYVVAVEDETSDGKPCIYLEDIAISTKVRGRGLAWRIMEIVIGKLNEKTKKDGKSILLSMHLRESSKRLLDKHKKDLEMSGLKLISEVIVLKYYSEKEDALYRVYKTE